MEPGVGNIVDHLYQETKITKEQCDKLKNNQDVVLDNQESTDRLFYFVNSMLMNMPDALDWDAMDSLTATITGSGNAGAKLGDLNSEDTSKGTEPRIWALPS